MPKHKPVRDELSEVRTRLDRFIAEFEALRTLGVFRFVDLDRAPHSYRNWEPHPYKFDSVEPERDNCYECGGGILHPIHATENQPKPRTPR